MRRLYWQVYATFVGILLLFGLLSTLAFVTLSPIDDGRLEPLAWVAGELLPGPEAAADDVSAALARLHAALDVSVAVWSAGGEPIAAVGDPLPAPEDDWEGSRFLRSRGAGLTLALALPDGRWAVVRHHRTAHASGSAVAVLVLLGVAVAVGAYPLVRRLTGRVERLQVRVDALGAGELGARVDVEGRDEVAELAKSFNRAAERIERLVEAQKTLLLGASHELRSPLARIRVAVDLLGEDVRPDLRDRIAEDVEELDELLGELLLVARLDTAEFVEQPQEVDLMSLAAEEASRFGAEVRGVSITIRGDVVLLRRLLRNLLSNARRYGGDAEIEVEVEALGTRHARLAVVDRGPGVAEGDRERIFEPFFRGENTSTNRGGIGLGLALVQRIAHLHGGHARFLPVPGGGARFEVELGSEQRPGAGLQSDAAV